MSFTARPAFTSAIDLEAKYRSLLAAHDETVHAVALLKREAELPAAKVDASLTSLQGKTDAIAGQSKGFYREARTTRQSAQCEEMRMKLGLALRAPPRLLELPLHVGDATLSVLPSALRLFAAADCVVAARLHLSSSAEQILGASLRFLLVSRERVDLLPKGGHLAGFARLRHRRAFSLAPVARRRRRAVAVGGGVLVGVLR